MFFPFDLFYPLAGVTFSSATISPKNIAISTRPINQQVSINQLRFNLLPFQDQQSRVQFLDCVDQGTDNASVLKRSVAVRVKSSCLRHYAKYLVSAKPRIKVF